MTMGWLTGALAALMLIFAVMPAAAQEKGAKDGKPLAAKVGGETITLEELEQAAGPELAQLEQQRHNLLEGRLDRLIGDRLLDQQAKKRGVTVEQLLKTEVYTKVPDVTDAEVTAFMTQNRARLPRGEESELRLKVWDFMRAQRVAQERAAYIGRLRQQGDVTVYLKEPTPVRLNVDPNVGFTRGPRDAPVTIVEFSDFQCPFCKTVVATLKQLAEKYPTQVKWTFRDFPIPSLHPAAPLAHEAARCAGAQGKFWDYHDVLFDRSPRASAQDLKQYANELKLDEAAFNQCLDSGKYRTEVNADMQEGSRLGVTGTPTFFINGRLLVGNQPIGEFQKLIDRELSRSAAR